MMVESLPVSIAGHYEDDYTVPPAGVTVDVIGNALERPMSGNIVNISDDSFENDVLQAQGPVLVDFWAEWCGPCKMIAPVLEQVADEYDSKLRVAKLNIDDNPESAPRYGVRGIPTLILFRNGEVVGTKVGALSKAQLTQFIDNSLN
jgi:thioredoxin 1